MSQAISRFDPIRPILIGVSILVLGNGLLSTLLSIRGTREAMSPSEIGWIVSAYFAGYVSGSYFCPPFVRSVGHIRTFAAFASLYSAAALVYLFSVEPLFWTILRLTQGFAYGAMILVVESWLNSGVSSEKRGSVLSLYQLVLIISWILSQFLLNLATVDSFALFCLVSILASLCLVPMTLAQIDQPSVSDPRTVSFRRLHNLSPLALVGVFMAGFSFNTFMSIFPVVGTLTQVSTEDVASLLVALLVGGFVLQWPLGWLSDRIDRRIVVLGATGINAIVLFFMLASDSYTTLFALSFVFGAASLCTYPICVAHINDFVDSSERLSVASSLILTYGIGAMIGPVTTGYVMLFIGPSGFFGMLFSLQACFFIYGLYRYFQRLAVAEEIKEDFVAVPRTTFASLELDDRVVPEESR